MRIYIASDHAGFELKKALIPYIGSLEPLRGQEPYEVLDVGPGTLDPEDDYPKTIAPCAQRVAEDTDSFGIVIGSSGQGEAMVANRQKGARAAVFYGRNSSTPHAIEAEGTIGTDSFEIIRVARRHNDANILSLGARFISEDDAREAVRIFLETPFSDAARHVRRITEF
jgi:ribose 5-phosphate isomerase B